MKIKMKSINLATSVNVGGKVHSYIEATKHNVLIEFDKADGHYILTCNKTNQCTWVYPTNVKWVIPANEQPAEQKTASTTGRRRTSETATVR